MCMKVGFAKSEITPKLPAYLAGFGGVQEAQSVADKLYVKVVVFASQSGYYGIITYDLIGVGEHFMAQLGKAMDAIQLDYKNFMISCTHTHAGPTGTFDTESGVLEGTSYVFGEYDEKYVTEVVNQSISALKCSLQSLEEAKVSQGHTIVAGICGNRNQPNLAGDDRLYAMHIQLQNKQRIAIVHFSCHPTIFDATNQSISADYVGCIDALLQKEGFAFCLFLNGSCGDISTRFTRMYKGKQEADRMASLIVQQLQTIQYQILKNSDIRVQFQNIVLKTKEQCDVEVAKRELLIAQKEVQKAYLDGIDGSCLRTIEARRDGAQSKLIFAQKTTLAESYEIPIQIFRCFTKLFIGVPGELFSQLSNEIHNPDVIFVSYCNGYYGYFADKDAYDYAYYEALSSPFAKGESEKIIQCVKKLLD